MAANTTVTVSLDDNDGDVTGVTLGVVYDDEGTEVTGYEPIVIEAGATSNTSTSTITVTDDDDYHHPRDKDVTITGTSGGYDDGTVMLSIREDDSPVGALSLSASPPSLSAGGDGSTELTASIAAEPGDDEDGNEITVSVTITTEHSVENASGGSATLDAIATDAKSTTGTLSGVAVTAEGTVTVTASAMNYTPATLEIDIISRTAGDLEGFRVTILAPAADGAWVGFGKKKVKVEVTRVNNYANDWERFSSIKVALRDTLDVTGLTTDGVAGDIYSLTASGFNNVDGEIVFSTEASNGGAFPANNNITYNEAGDKLLLEV